MTRLTIIIAKSSITPKLPLGVSIEGLASNSIGRLEKSYLHRGGELLIIKQQEEH